MIGRLLREPLTQFVLLGLLLFVGYHGLERARDARDEPGRIEITADDLRQIVFAWVAQGRAAPSPEEVRSLVDARVREEIFYREALALGLDKDDTIVRRRMAQKMEFLFEDVAALRDPTTDELRAWFAGNAQRFALAPRVTFRHLYFSPDRRGARAREDASRVLEGIAGKPADAPEAAALADRFMFQDYYADRAFDDVAKTFGPGFARALLDAAPGAWAGPIASGYGWHLVWVEAVTPERVPAFEEVEAEARAGWIEEQRAQVRDKAFAAMRARYEIVVPEDLGVTDVASVAPRAGAPLAGAGVE